MLMPGVIVAMFVVMFSATAVRSTEKGAFVRLILSGQVLGPLVMAAHDRVHADGANGVHGASFCG